MADSKRQVEKMMKGLRLLGWAVRCNKHWVATPPGGGRPISFSITPSDNYAVANMRRDLAKRGIRL